MILVDHDPAWPACFARLAAELARALRPRPVHLEHLGSTAVHGVPARPIIDLGLAVPAADLRGTVERLLALGYVRRWDVVRPDDTTLFVSPREPCHVVYLCAAGAPALRAALAVRDHLRMHPDLAALYGAFKRELAAGSGGDPRRYHAGTAAFAAAVATRALALR